VAEFTKNCECRKPKPGALLEAAKKYEIDLRNSWMIGDQDSDVQCGQAAGCQTILIQNPHSKEKRGKSAPTFTAATLMDAAKVLENLKENNSPHLKHYR
jgi:D-glycero-D-manno-heptose 1,7-bisphosphate phosphatase